MMRRAADPTLRWRAVGTDQQYRVAVRNEDTGRKAIIYEGFRLDCRLPADLRLISDQLTYRVETRPGSDMKGRFVRCQPFTVIPRIGDAAMPQARDRLSIPPVPGCTEYRLQVRECSTRTRLTDMVGPAPWFLLPAGQLMDRDTEWSISAKSGETWERSEWKRVRQPELDAAMARAETPVPISIPPRPKIEPAPWKPGSSASMAACPPHRAGVAVVVPVTAQPRLGPAPSIRSVVESQWIGASGDGAVESASRYLASRNHTGWFFLDIDAAHALNFDAMVELAAVLRRDGHRIGLYIGADWSLVRGDPAPPSSERLAQMLADLAPLSGETIPAVMLGAGPSRSLWIEACRANGVAAVVATRGALQGCPQWMQWRTTPFVGIDGLMICPTAMILSTPAHPRDQVLRHPFSNRDAVVSGAAASTLKALIDTDGPGALALIEIDPLRLLTRRWKRSRAEANTWNEIIAAELPGWVAAGWKRTPTGFESGAGIGEIQLDILGSLLGAIEISGVTAADFLDVFGAERAGGWLQGERPLDLILEQKRGARLHRPSAIRRYDEAFRQALRTPDQ